MISLTITFGPSWPEGIYNKIIKKPPVRVVFPLRVNFSKGNGAIVLRKKELSGLWIFVKLEPSG